MTSGYGGGRPAIEYQRAFENFSDDEQARRRRLAAQEALRKLDTEEAALLGRQLRIEDVETGPGPRGRGPGGAVRSCSGTPGSPSTRRARSAGSWTTG